MEIYTFQFPVPHLIIDDLYTDDELSLIWKELEFLTPKLKVSAKETGGNSSKKINKGVFLNDVYCDKKFSDILTINKKIFDSKIVDEIKKIDIDFDCFELCNHTDNNFTLINYYENCDEYKPHFDFSLFTAITFFHKNPKSFTGGEFVFSEHNYKIEPKNNRLIIFFGKEYHCAIPVKMINDDFFNGRYSMVQFLPDPHREKFIYK
jgi:hypothetical protein